MTRIEALRILVRYMPERSIHITESLDSSYHKGDRTDNENAFVTINPGINQTMPECFSAETIDAATTKAMGAHYDQSQVSIYSENRFEADQRRAFAILNAQ